MSQKVALKRTLSLPQLVLYGLGTTIGAGIYALVGELAGISGFMAPASFLLASIMAGFTALSFAELSARFPRCAGASLYVEQGFYSVRLSTIVGMMVIAAGLISSAALVNGFVGYLNQFITLDRLATIVTVCLILCAIAAWGIAESIIIAAVITIVEIGGLVMVIAVSFDGIIEASVDWHDLLPEFSSQSIGSIVAGSLLAFYAFIGFEDMVEVAEEARQVRRNLPLAILLTLVITGFLYMAIMISAVLTVPLDLLADSEAPLALVYAYHTQTQPVVISIIGLFAIINGALIQMIMVSRVIYGLSSRGQLPRHLGKVHSLTRTPLLATVLVASLVLVLALMGSLASLAEATSLVMLMVFAMVNLSLCKIKIKDPHPDGMMVFPFWIPVAGFLVSAAFVFSGLL